MSPPRCPVCASPVPVNIGSGPPRIYCSSPCRNRANQRRFNSQPIADTDHPARRYSNRACQSCGHLFTPRGSTQRRCETCIRRARDRDETPATSLPDVALLDPSRIDPDWWQQAACRGVDPDLFFPQRGELTWAAKEVCGRCEVRAECLTIAVQDAEKFGIWGGKSERERRRIRRNRNRGIRTFNPPGDAA